MAILLNSYLVASFIATLITLIHSKAINDLLTKESMERYFSVSSIDEVPEYEIINPVSVSSGRRRRSTDGSEYPDIHEVKLTAFGEDYHMKLWKNKALIPPGSVVEHVHENGTVVKTPIVNNCHYFGELASHATSRIAISTCSGISGIFSHGTTDVYIQPLQEDHAKKIRRRRSDLEHPHVIFRRSAGDMPNMESDETKEAKKHFCGNDAKYYHDEKNVNMMAMPVKSAVEGEGEVEGEATRTKRQTSTAIRHLEILVVTDYQMRAYHGNKLEDYTLTLMNIAASRFADPSLRTHVKLYITKMITMEGDTIFRSGAGYFTATNNAGETLNNFCIFQQKLEQNPAQGSDPVEWDNAVLISRKNLHYNYNYNLLGLASLWSTCNSRYQCSMNEELGLGAGLTITHEIGHTLGIQHDGRGNNCRDYVNIMSSSRTAGSGSFTWSTCSGDQLQGFLSTWYSDCTRDEPNFLPPGLRQTVTNDLPGKTYDADFQCRLVFGDSYSACNFNPTADECAYLRCKSEYSSYCSVGTGSARMDGTPCGGSYIQKVCMQGKCVDDTDTYAPVDGGWSNPSFGTCSRSCGGGVQVRQRFCNNPEPAYGGAECVGDDKQYRACNLQPCRTTQEDFRNEQCASTNNELYKYQYYQWTGFTTNLQGDNLCAFICRSTNGQPPVTASRGEYFIDGTRCDVAQPASNKFCVKGKCIEFGCDGEQNSGAEFDQCGICRGDGTSCTQQSGTVSQVPPVVETYTNILTIPVKATNVKIVNVNSQFHMAAKVYGQYVIGGTANRPIDMEYKYGTQSFFHESNPETIVIPGPLSAIVEIEMYMHGNAIPSISWEYYLPLQTYAWFESNDFTDCSKSCGTAFKSRMIVCIDKGASQIVDDSYCSGIPRPQVQLVKCHLPDCRPTLNYLYVVGAFGDCSATCGSGTRSREIKCAYHDGNDLIFVPITNCNQNGKPNELEQCNVGPCPTGVWVVGEWSTCSESCGEGVRSRSVNCKQSANSFIYMVESECPPEKPSTEESCTAAPCPSPSNPNGECNELLTAESTSVVVGNTNGVYCNKTIVAPINQRIVLTFIRLYIDCRNGGDFIVKDGQAYKACFSLNNQAWPRSKLNVMELAAKTTNDNEGYEISFTFETVEFQIDDQRF